MSSASVAIQISNLTRWYRKAARPAVDNLTLSIRQGSITGLLGPNGAGKTTTIRILCGLLFPSSGDVTIHSLSVRTRMREIRRIIGVVPQEIALYPSLTAHENLTIYGRICGMDGRTLKERMDELLEITGLLKHKHIRVSRYSGGMKRRLNLAAGLLHKPAILFLDEPTVGVDVQSKNTILENLIELNRQGTTIIYTSHYLDEAEQICQDIAIMDEGKIHTSGSIGDIRSRYGSNARLEDIFLELTGKRLRD